MTRISFLFLAIIIALNTPAQNRFSHIKGVSIKQFSSQTQLPLFVSIDNTERITNENFTNWLQEQFVNDTKISFSIIKSETDELNITHTHFNQKYNGYLIDGSMIIAHSKLNSINSFNGDWYRDISMLNSIALTENEALQFALNKVAAKKYKWENEVLEKHMQATFNSNFTYKPKGEIVVLPFFDKKEKRKFLYAYKFNIYAEEPLYRANIFVDAATGEIIKEQNLICTADAVGSANTKYSGTRPITTDSYSGGYRLKESGRGQGIETYNLNNTSNYVGTLFTNTTNNWTQTGPDQAATDAHFGTEAYYDYLSQNFNRNSLDNNGYKLQSYVHYGVNYINAFWDGQVMTYGDGDLSLGYDVFTALDICGHELTHGLVHHTAGLLGGEAGALNEGFADIFGTCLEWTTRPTQRDWLMGQEIGTTVRNMSDPNALSDPDTYMGNFWSSINEPHTNAGPCIYWFYLLSTGGNGTNDNNYTYAISGIGMSKAAAIAYRALNNYMTPNTTYNDVRLYTGLAAEDLFGTCSNEVAQTNDAWYAVGVGFGTSSNPDFIADQTFSCIAPSMIGFTNAIINASSFKWYFGDGTTSTNTNPVHTYTANGTYSVKLVFTKCNGIKDSITKNNYIDINSSNPCYMSSNATTYTHCSGSLVDDGGTSANYSDLTNYQATIALATGNSIALTFTNFNMEHAYDSLLIYSGPTASGTPVFGYTGSSLPNSGSPIIINNNVITIVQHSDYDINKEGYKLDWSCISGIENIDSEESILLFPNPTQDIISFSNIKDVNRIEIYNMQGALISTENISNVTTYTISTAHFPDGIYFSKLYSKSGVSTKKIIKN